MSNKFNPKKNKADRRKRHPSLTQEPGMNRAHRRTLKARERMFPSFTKATRIQFLKQIQDKQHKEALIRKINKQSHAK